MSLGIRQLPIWLLWLSVAWAAIWCCCTPPSKPQHAGAVRSCCAPAQSQQSDCPVKSPDECPIIHVRANSLPAHIDAIPPMDHPPVAFAMPADVLAAVISPSRAVRNWECDSGPPPRDSSTLLALSTSLVC